MYSGFYFSDKEVFHNTKIEQYPNGVERITVCSKPIFKSECYEPVAEKAKVSKPQKPSNEPRTDSCRRAKKSVYNIAVLNSDIWEYFVTLTLNGENIDRTSPEQVYRCLRNFLQNMTARYNMKYLLVPEYHSDGKAIHVHFLCRGNFKLVDSGTVLIPNYSKPVKAEKALKLCSDVSLHRTVYNLPQWTLGFSTAIKLQGNIHKIANYIAKYITKENYKIFGHFFLSSRKVIQRKVPTKYIDIDYYSVDSKEYTVPAANLGFKYLSNNAERGENNDNLYDLFC